MTPERWRQIESLFVQAVDRPPSERDLFLDELCQGDDELRRELESLLACDDPDRSLIEIEAPGSADEAGDPSAEADMSGQRAGLYRLTALIGHGGMGAVYLGVRDDDQFQKQVAIKILKRGMDTDFLLRRFRQERQILAGLEHPFIARLIDGGAMDDGRPYLVMEHVDGVPITRYCAENSLSIPERLRLFRLVCEAVQHAHQHLVVHRDIKPSNILTTREGVPKLLDFGIAKVLHPGLPEGLTLTRREQQMMTPDYASPEQFRGLPISTASDTYSLGAVLYELLSGERPHRFESDSLVDLERAICEVDPLRPSLVAPKHLRRRLSGDLDNIVLTAMRKEPQRRYASAAEFSEDLRRHLEGLPVLARDHRWTYRAGKFIRRNRIAVGAALVVAATLVGGMVTTAVQARRAERRFEVAREMARAVVANVTGPMERLPGSTSIRASMIQTVLPYLDKLAEDAGKDPVFELEIADAYRQVANVEGHPLRQNLGRTSAAITHYEKAIEIYSRLMQHPETRVAALAGVVEANIQVGDVEARNGSPDAADTRLQRAAAIATEAAARDSRDLVADTWAYLYFRLIDAETRKGAFDQAVVYGRKAVEVCQQWASTDHGVNARGTLRGAYSKLGHALVLVGDLRGAREYFEIALKHAQDASRQPDVTVHERTMLSASHQDLANLLGNPYELNVGSSAEALAHNRLAVEPVELLAAADPNDVRARDDLATVLVDQGAILIQGQPAEALQVYKRAARIAEGVAAEIPSNTRYRLTLALAQIGVGESLQRLGRSQEAIQSLETAMESATAAKTTTNFIPALGAASRIHRGMGDAFLAYGDEKTALGHYNQAVADSEALVRRLPGSLHFQMFHATSLESLGRYYTTLSRRRPELKGEARKSLGKALEVWQDWSRRRIAEPFAESRRRQTAALLASIDKR